MSVCRTAEKFSGSFAVALATQLRWKSSNWMSSQNNSKVATSFSAEELPVDKKKTQSETQVVWKYPLIIN